MLRTNELERVSDNASVILCLHFTFSLPSSFGKSPNDFEMLSTPNIAKRLMSRCMGKRPDETFRLFIDVGRALSYTMYG